MNQRTIDAPMEITLHGKSRLMEVVFASEPSNLCFQMSFEFLRIYSPSAEVRGHGGEGAVLQTGKREVEIMGIEPVGNYAIRLVFSDGHSSGIYTWPYLYQLGIEMKALWLQYEEKLRLEGWGRDDPMPIKARGCH